MGISQVIQQTGLSGMTAAKNRVATTGHNIANANTEGYSRQRVLTQSTDPQGAPGSHGMVGTGVAISRVERLNDEYVEKQIRNAARDMGQLEEKDQVLKHVEDIFNEMNGDGLNRITARFFNEFRKLANEPENEGVRQSVREASQAVVNDFHRLRQEVREVQDHIDSKIRGYCGEINSAAQQLKDLNLRIKTLEVTDGPPNDLLDTRDKLIKNLASFVDITTHADEQGQLAVDVRGLGPLVSGSRAETFTVERTQADGQGKPDGALDVISSATVSRNVTHRLKGGKLGALLELRDQMLSGVASRLDEMAFSMSGAVNEIHAQGFTRDGATGVAFFKPLDQSDRAAELMDLSQDVSDNVNNIATAAEPDAPGDNRIALAISGLQNQKLMGHGHATLDEWYNSMVGDVGTAAGKNRLELNQQKDVTQQLGKMRDQISSVSLDEETANLMQFQHTYDVSAKVIQIADEMLRTVLEMKR